MISPARIAGAASQSHRLRVDSCAETLESFEAEDAAAATVGVGTAADGPDAGGGADNAITSSGTLCWAVRLESVSRLRRCKSARRSAACWYRSLRSFSSALLIMRSSSADDSGFSRTGETGAL